MDWLSEIQEKEDKSFHAVRKSGIGSSDIATILGVSPYNDIMTLWREKTGIEENPFKGNFATERGKRLEPEIRDWVNNTLKANYQPESRFLVENPVFRANADGVDHKIKSIIEIKTAGKEDHETACRGEVPKKYYPQCQWLMMVFEYDSLLYVSNNEGSNVIVKVKRDKEFQENMKSKALEFWRHVENKTSPLGDVSEDLEQQLAEWEMLKEQEKIIKERLAKLTASISEKVTVKKLKINNFSVTWSERKGSIQYDKIEVLKTIDLEQYRGEPSTYLSIRRIKDGKSEA